MKNETIYNLLNYSNKSYMNLFYEKVSNNISIINSVSKYIGSISLFIFTTFSFIPLLIINYTFSFIVFFTTLFYLLSMSKYNYKPFDWILFFNSNFDFGDLQLTLSKSVIVSFQSFANIIAFHAMSFYFTLKLFNIEIVYITTLLSIFFAFFPLFDVYLLSIPTCFYLFFTLDRPFQSILFFSFHFLGNWFIDPLFYFEMNHIHPYVIGFVIVGGFFFFFFIYR
jgi:hypothetical protein